MIKSLRNTTGSDITYNGQVIHSGATYTVQPHESELWSSDTIIHNDITNGNIIVNDGMGDLSASEGLSYFKGFNASCIKDVKIDDSGKADGKVLMFKSASGKIEYSTPSSTSQDSQIVSSSTLFSTNSTTFTDVPGMSITTSNSQNTLYSISFSGTIDISNKAHHAEIQLVINGVAVPHSFRRVSVSTNGQGASISTQELTVLGNNVQVKVQCRTTGNSIDIAQRSLIIRGI